MPISLWQRDRIHVTTESRFRTIDPTLVPTDFRDQFQDLDDDRQIDQLVYELYGASEGSPR